MFQLLFGFGTGITTGLLGGYYSGFITGFGKGIENGYNTGYEQCSQKLKYKNLILKWKIEIKKLMVLVLMPTY